jgi:LysM repeat protein
VRIATLIATVVLGAGVLSAQSLGDVARQERARRAGLEKHAKVLTNEDLAREQILPAQDKESAASPALQSPVTPVAPAPAAVAEKHPETPAGAVPQPQGQEISLGEYARAIRAERASREARAQSEPSASVTSSAPPVAAAAEERPWVKDDSGIPTWTAAEQPGFSLGEYARAQRALRHKDVPVLTLDAKAKPAPMVPSPKPPSLTAKRQRPISPARPAALPAAPPAQALVVQKGDSLWKLSRKDLGEGRLWPALWTANPQIRNPHLIHPGQSLSRPSEAQVAEVRRAIARNPMLEAKLAPAPQLQTFRPRPMGLQLGGDHGRKTLTGQVDVPAGLAVPAGRGGFPRADADLDRVRGAESYNGPATQLLRAKRPVLPDLPGHGGLR